MAIQMTNKSVMAHTYVIPLLDGSMIKIGHTRVFSSRIITLRNYWGEFDLDRGFLISSPQNWTSHKMFESFLHHTFNGYRITDLARVHSGDGSGEFFEIECFDEVKEFSSRYVDIRYRHDKVTTMSNGARHIDSVFETPYKQPR